MSIFVGNLPFRAEREDVVQLFAPFGEVLNCSLPLERDTGRKRGFAFIEMADEAIESKAIDGLQGAELMGRPLRINKAEPRGSGGPRRGGRGGNNGGYGGGNNGGYGGGGNNGGYGGGGYGGGNNGSNSPNSSKSSGAEGWEDRSYGNSSDNSEYENGRSRRKRGVSSESNASNETN
ncbi:RNA-binding protein [uncultured Prochlorococcus sp.]|uniref:RNA recognition motif domain-containing protein n=1 Tax=uncultured Prochlorococcus sp. TaxID=159733 RepID=UPI00258C044E|nr:RNA-binding protein [uncultured Prochlorococcus sp.]